MGLGQASVARLEAARRKVGIEANAKTATSAKYITGLTFLNLIPINKHYLLTSTGWWNFG